MKEGLGSFHFSCQYSVEDAEVARLSASAQALHCFHSSVGSQYIVDRLVNVSMFVVGR